MGHKIISWFNHFLDLFHTFPVVKSVKVKINLSTCQSCIYRSFLVSPSFYPPCEVKYSNISGPLLKYSDVYTETVPNARLPTSSAISPTKSSIFHTGSSRKPNTLSTPPSPTPKHHIVQLLQCTKSDSRHVFYLSTIFSVFRSNKYRKDIDKSAKLN